MRLVDNIFNSILGKGKIEPYTYYDYLESDGNGQYIDTGVLTSSKLRIVCKCFGRSGYTNLIAFGSRDRLNTNELSLRLHSPSPGNLGRITASYNVTREYAINIFVAGEVYDIDFNRNVVSVVGNQGTSRTVTIKAATFASTTRNMYLFGFNGTSTPSVPGVCICKCQIYDNDVLVRDLRPAVRKSDGVAGMLDVVNNVFHPNANPAGDNFLYGNLT